MIDFGLKTADQKVGGLNMGLCPGTYAGRKSLQESIYVAEGAFTFLEPSIRKYSPQYARSYSHWGVTEISRQEWHNIIEDWKRLKRDVEAAKTVQEFGRICLISREVEREFTDRFELNKTALSKMIEQLSDWLRVTLNAQPQVTVLGI